jgi:hypothetical protein
MLSSVNKDINCRFSNSIGQNSSRSSSITTIELRKSDLSVKSHLSLTLYLLPICNDMVPPERHNGWNVPLGMHRVSCACPGLHVTTQVYRQSAPVVIARHAVALAITGSSHWRVLGEIAEVELVVPPGSYINVLETRIHGNRIRGRICWEEEGDGERDHGTKGGESQDACRRYSSAWPSPSRAGAGNGSLRGATRGGLACDGTMMIWARGKMLPPDR